MTVGRQRRVNVEIPHDLKPNAICERPVLVSAFGEQIQPALKQLGLSGTISTRGLARNPDNKDKKSSRSPTWAQALPNSNRTNSVVIMRRLILD